MSWEVFSVIRNHMVQNVFGSTLLFSLFILIIITILLLSMRTPLVPAIMVLLLACFGLSEAGWFGASWVTAAIFVILALLYSFIINALVKD